jgi:hypothetical protein
MSTIPIFSAGAFVHAVLGCVVAPETVDVMDVIPIVASRLEARRIGTTPLF